MYIVQKYCDIGSDFITGPKLKCMCFILKKGIIKAERNLQLFYFSYFHPHLYTVQCTVPCNPFGFSVVYAEDSHNEDNNRRIQIYVFMKNYR